MIKEEKRTIISIIMVVIIIWLVIMTVVTAQENSKTKIELEEAKQNLEEAKQELAEYKTDELEIYPCPFCGSEDIHIVDMYGKGTDYYVKCENCHASGSLKNPNTSSWCMTKTEAIELWNAAYKRGNEE